MPGVCLLWIKAPHIARSAQPGQFITVRCDDLPLRRPFSIHLTLQDEIALLFKIKGKGTAWLSRRREGDAINVIGPLGNTFTVRPDARNLLLIAGGIGIAPLVFLVQRIGPEHQITLVHGASSAAQLYPFSPPDKASRDVCSLPHNIQLIPITEDGSSGRKGKATDVLPHFLPSFDQMYACGPVEMYQAMAAMHDTCVAAKDHALLENCQVSLEIRMGCGLGACFGCTINTKKGPKRVCCDGPIFKFGEIIWPEVRL
jgi:dihydroorotate dehydrogenase electron transfer subunit